MAANTDQLRRAIQPGSVPYGDRQTLEQNLGAAAPQGAPMAAPPMGPTGAPMDAGDLAPPNPLDPLLSGELDANPDSLNAGLTTGASAPFMDPFPQDDLVSNLRAISLYARSPALRELARRSLRTEVRSINVE